MNMKNILGIFLILMTFVGHAQNLSVTGTVVDAADGTPIPGVSVVVVGSTTGVITDFDGIYSIDVEKGKTIRFSFMGLESQEVVVESSSINVKMETSSTDLEEVVVVGYGVKKKALVTGANVNVKGDAIMEVNTSSAMEALQGVTAGISITRNNGAPGAGTSVKIRGLGTIGDASPLYIVDGVAVGSIDYLSASDIGSIDVLKDAASAAIYGSRAANGVVLVTTKKGKKGVKPQVTYDGYYGVQNVYKKVAALNAQEYMFIQDEARSNDGLAPFDWEAELSNNSWLEGAYSGSLGTQLGSDIWASIQSGWEGTDWVDEITAPDAPIQSHAFNLTGASETATYSLGLSYFDQTGIIGGDISNAGYKRFTARINTEFIIAKNDDRTLAKLGENFTYTNTENRGVATGDIYWNDMHNAIVQNPLTPVYWESSPDQYGYTPTLDGWAPAHHNPVAKLFYGNNFNWGKGNTIAGNAYLEIEPMKDLVFRSSFGINAWFGHGRSWSPTYALGNLYRNETDQVSQNMYQGVDYTFTNTLRYERYVGDHKVGLLVGQEILDNILNTEMYASQANSTFGDPKYAYLNNTLKTSIDAVNVSGADWAAQGGGLMSYMARASYNYKEKYIVDATLRADGSSNFAEGNRWGVFPSVSAGWNMTEEDFLANNPVIGYAKLRASWGQNGNQNISNFIYSSNISYIDPGYYFGDSKTISSPTAVPSTVPNPDVSWETSEQLNIGLDTRLFDNKLSVTLDWYNKTTKDWLVEAPILGTAGASAPYINGGSVSNRGFEISMSWNDSYRNLKYGATVSGAYNKNKVVSLDNAEGVIHGTGNTLAQGTAYVSRVEVGKPIGYFYGFKADGILQNQQEVDEYVAPEGADNAGSQYFEDQRPGDVQFVDQNGDGVIDDSDKVMLGDPNPDFELGIQLNAEYKNIYANITLAGKMGMQVMRSYRSFASNMDDNYTTEIFGRWHGEGTSNLLPRLSAAPTRNTNYISDIYMHNADYLRVSNLTVGYKMKDLLADANWLQNAKVYVGVNNLYTFTKYDGMDPEVGYAPDSWGSGIDLGLYPSPRTVTFGINLTY